MFVTLTYPKDFPWSGEECKRHLKALRERMRRRWGRRAMLGIWKMEFQKRGAPHFHLVIECPQEDRELSRKWLSQAWYEVVGSGDEKHLRAGTQLVPWRSEVGAYLSGYCAKDKSYQNVAPEGFEGMGRWWGVWGSRDAHSPARVVWDGFMLPLEQATELRRLMWRYRASKCPIEDSGGRHRYRRSMAKASSLWVVGGSASDQLAEKLISAAVTVANRKAS